MKLSLKERKELAAKMPWVTKLTTPVGCTGWMERRKPCKKPAYWRYRHLVSDRDRPIKYLQFYCWTHLIYRGIYGTMAEEERTNKWLRKNGFPDAGKIVEEKK